MLNLPEPIAQRFKRAEAHGHKLVSQGCALFRCTQCNLRGYLDDDWFADIFTAQPCKIGNEPMSEHETMSEDERADFRSFCEAVTDAQLDAIVEKEESAHGHYREACAIARDVRNERERARRRNH